MINLTRKLRISALSWHESFLKTKVLEKMKTSCKERSFEAFWRQIFSTEFYYTKSMHGKVHLLQNTIAWLILLESWESQFYRGVNHLSRRKFGPKWKLFAWTSLKTPWHFKNNKIRPKTQLCHKSRLTLFGTLRKFDRV